MVSGIVLVLAVEIVVVLIGQVSHTGGDGLLVDTV